MDRFADWLETRWVTPAYSGWVLGGLTLFFLGAATNSMAGWLYVISGVSLALLVIAAILPVRSLRGIRVVRASIQPVSAGEPLAIEVSLKNQTNQSKSICCLPCRQNKRKKNIQSVVIYIPVIFGKKKQNKYKLEPIGIIPPGMPC